MKVHMDCIPCFLRQALTASRFITDDVTVHERILRRVIYELGKMEWTSTPPKMAQIVHRIVREECKSEDPYREVKRYYNDAALELYSEMEHMIKGSEDPLLRAVLLSIAGNIIDFGPNSEFELERTISSVLEKGLTVDDYDEFKQSLRGAKTLVYLADNTGEIVFDKLLIETILGMYDLGSISFAVKGAPIINDATLKDALYTGLDKIPGIRFIEVGVGLPGTGMERNSIEFHDMLESVDVVISKGQGNYEALSEQSGIFFLLMAKCPVLADDLNVDLGATILKKG